MENQQKRLDFIGQIVGKYSLVEQVNYEEYLKAIGELLYIIKSCLIIQC
jgi:hypothetical protein